MEEIIGKMITFQQQLRILHWGTRSYARHKAFDEIYADLHGLIDEFVEIYQGKNGIMKFEGGLNIKLEEFKAVDINSLLNEFAGVLVDEVPEQLKEMSNTDLLNIRDEILGTVNKLRYLLRLK